MAQGIIPIATRTTGKFVIPYPIATTETESSDWDPGYYSRVLFDKTLYDRITGIYYVTQLSQAAGTDLKLISSRLVNYETDLPIPGSEVSATLGPWQIVARRSSNLLSYFNDPLMLDQLFQTEIKAEATCKGTASSCSLLIEING